MDDTQAPELERPGIVQQRAPTFLGRIAQALRDQNWAAVVIEVGIVVLGVVIGFQVTAWGQSRSNAARERVYITQLVRDLHETERGFETAEAAFGPIEHANTELLRAYRRPGPPPPDSVVAWLSRAFFFANARPAYGTAEALVETGELALIRDDSLRNAITVYVEDLRAEDDFVDGTSNLVIEGFVSGVRRFDLYEAIAMTQPQALIDSLALSDPRFPLPSGPRTRPFPIDVDEILSDRELYGALVLYGGALSNLRASRSRVLAKTRDLLAYLEETERL